MSLGEAQDRVGAMSRRDWDRAEIEGRRDGGSSQEVRDSNTNISHDSNTRLCVYVWLNLDRVKQAIVKKEEVMAQLREQHQAALKRADHLEGLLDQQRKQLLGSKKWITCAAIFLHPLLSTQSCFSFLYLGAVLLHKILSCWVQWRILVSYQLVNSIFPHYYCSAIPVLFYFVLYFKSFLFCNIFKAFHCFRPLVIF